MKKPVPTDGAWFGLEQFPTGELIRTYWVSGKPVVVIRLTRSNGSRVAWGVLTGWTENGIPKSREFGPFEDQDQGIQAFHAAAMGVHAALQPKHISEIPDNEPKPVRRDDDPVA